MKKSEAQFLLQQLPEVVSCRASLSRKAVDASTLRTQHEEIIANHFLADKALTTAESALERITTAMWVEIPVLAETPEHFLTILARSDPFGWNTFLRCVHADRPKLGMGANAIVSFARSRLFPLTFWSVIRAYRRLNELAAEKN